MRIIINILFLLISTELFAVDFIFSGELGYGNYGMSQFKDLNNEVIRQIDFPAKVVDDFPFNPYHQLNIKIKNNSLIVGFFYSQQSTGSRIHYADYSGEYTFDNILIGNNYGLLFEAVAGSFNKFHFHIYGEAGIQKTKVDFSEEFRLYEVSEIYSESMELDSRFFELGVKFVYTIQDFMISANLGFGNNFFKEEYFDGLWNGLRPGLELSYVIRGKSK